MHTKSKFLLAFAAVAAAFFALGFSSSERAMFQAGYASNTTWEMLFAMAGDEHDALIMHGRAMVYHELAQHGATAEMTSGAYIVRKLDESDASTARYAR